MTYVKKKWNSFTRYAGKGRWRILDNLTRAGSVEVVLVEGELASKQGKESAPIEDPAMRGRTWPCLGPPGSGLKASPQVPGCWSNGLLWCDDMVT